MATPLKAYIDGLYRYPVKGLMRQELASVNATKHSCFPYDRVFAIENGPARFDPKAPKPLPKVNFLMLMRDERLALLQSQFDEESETLTILRDGRQVAKGVLSTSIGRNMLEQFFAAFMADELKGAPRILSADNHHFTDKPGKFVHIINLSSVTALSHLLNETIDPARFRANIHIKGLEPWIEKRWQGQILKCDNVQIRIIEETTRCAAVNIDLETAKRGKSLPATLSQHFGTSNFGVYGEIIEDGELRQGCEIEIIKRN